MPLYEYQCEACTNRFELIRKFSDPPLEICPQCGGTVKKLFSSPAIQFKGSGWYITDYAKKTSGDTSGTTSTKSDATSDSSSDKSETKTDKKPDKPGTATNQSSTSESTTKKD